MTRIEQSVFIQAPVEQVFAYASDYQKWSEWFEGVSDFKPTTAVTRGSGARYQYKARLMGFAARVETEIHDFHPNSGWRGVATAGMPHRTGWVFEPMGLGSKFTYILEYRVPVPLLGPLLDRFFLKPQWNKIIQNSLANLSRHFIREAGSTPPQPSC
jgi:coenzyme Q-binding protein COQ10